MVWLVQRYEARGELEGACETVRRLFSLRPELPSYQEVHRLAITLGRWGRLRPALLAFLEKQRRSDLLMQIALREGEIDRALELLPGVLRHFLLVAIDLAVQVAQVAEEPRPRAALELYRQRVAQLIAQRGRGNYVEACHLLVKMRDLHAYLDEDNVWIGYLAALREQHRPLRALKEELVAEAL
jgi:uncharacterized Zn finger protein